MSKLHFKFFFIQQGKLSNLKANNIQIIIRLKMIAALVIQKRGNHKSIASLNHLKFQSLSPYRFP